MRKFIVLWVLLLAATCSAGAQFSAYLTASYDALYFRTASCPSLFQCGESGGPPTPNNGEPKMGIGGGLTYDYPWAHRLKFGADFRFAANSGDPGGAFVAFSGQVMLVPRYHRLRPYGRVGYGHLSAHTDTDLACFCFATQEHGPPEINAGNGFLVFGGGLDVHILGGFAVRAIDFAASPGPSAGSGTTAANASPEGVISFGVLYRFDTLQHDH